MTNKNERNGYELVLNFTLLKLRENNNLIQ